MRPVVYCGSERCGERARENKIDERVEIDVNPISVVEKQTDQLVCLPLRESVSRK